MNFCTEADRTIQILSVAELFL